MGFQKALFVLAVFCAHAPLAFAQHIDDPLIRMLRDRRQPESNRLYAIEQLAKSTHPSVSKVLLKFAKNEQELRSIRSLAIRSLGLLKTPEASVYLEQIVDKRIDESYAGSRSSYGLGSYYPEAVEALGHLAALDKPDSVPNDIQARAYHMLGEAFAAKEVLGYQDTVSLMSALTVSNHEDVLKYAKEILKENVDQRKPNQYELNLALIYAIIKFKDEHSIELLDQVAYLDEKLKPDAFYAIVEIAKHLREKCAALLAQ